MAISELRPDWLGIKPAGGKHGSVICIFWVVRGSAAAPFPIREPGTVVTESEISARTIGAVMDPRLRAWDLDTVLWRLHCKVVQRNEAAMQIGAVGLPRIIEDAVIGVIEDEVVSFDMDDRYPANIAPALCLA